MSKKQPLLLMAVAIAVLALLAIVGFLFVSGDATTGDETGADDSGVVHPQPLGVDDDVSSN